MVAFNFNTQNLPDGGDGFDLIPTGWYAGFADETGINPTRDGAGAYIKARFRIQGPAHANRVIFKNFNIRNSNDKAVEIGYRELGQWCHSAGRPAINDTQELHGALVEFYVTTRNDPTGQYEPQNEIRRFRKPGTGALGPTVAATMPVGTAQPQQAYTPPANNPFAAQVPRGAVEQASAFTVNNPFAAPAPQPQAQAAQPQLAGNPFAAPAPRHRHRHRHRQCRSSPLPSRGSSPRSSRPRPPRRLPPPGSRRQRCRPQRQPRRQRRCRSGLPRAAARKRKSRLRSRWTRWRRLTRSWPSSSCRPGCSRNAVQDGHTKCGYPPTHGPQVRGPFLNANEEPQHAARRPDNEGH